MDEYLIASAAQKKTRQDELPGVWLGLRELLDGIRFATIFHIATKRKRTTATRKLSTGKRQLLKTRSATFFAKRTAKGQFKEMAERAA